MAKVIKTLAYVDEVASLSEEAAHDIGITLDDGAGTDASRHDHVHVLGADTVDNSTIAVAVGVLSVKANGITEAQIANDAVGSEHIETLDAALDAGQQEFQSALFHRLAADPDTPATGQWWMLTTTDKVRVCISAA